MNIDSRTIIDNIAQKLKYNKTEVFNYIAEKLSCASHTVKRWYYGVYEINNKNLNRLSELLQNGENYSPPPQGQKFKERIFPGR